MKLTPDQKAGLYITAIVHLAVIIVLLLGQIGYAVQRENSFVLDFTKQEEQERIEQQEELSRTALAQLENLLAAARTQPVRNVTVNRSQLKDDRNTDADQLYPAGQSGRLRPGSRHAAVRSETPQAGDLQRPFRAFLVPRRPQGHPASHSRLPLRRCR